MALVLLREKAVGSIVKLNVDGVAKEFYVMHQGLPVKASYDASCNGTWLLMKDCYEKRAWGPAGNMDYAASTIHSYLNSTFLNKFDAQIQGAIKLVTIPHADGLSLQCKIFLLNTDEISAVFSLRGTDMFDATFDGDFILWFTRVGVFYGGEHVYAVLPSESISGGSSIYTRTAPTTPWGIRPTLILPDTLFVDEDGKVRENQLPAISGSAISGSDLGIKSEAFSFSYTVNDLDGDTMTATEKLDGRIKKVWTDVASGTELTIPWLAEAEEFQKILNGNHTVTVEVSDGQAQTTAQFNFDKAVHQASITLSEPLATAGDITMAVLAVVGDIPEDANYKVEVTNNGKDPSPVWQDVTADVRSGTNIVFDNHVAANGAAFNFLVTVERGASGVGGYISAITGAFQ